ncbi:metal ABC transporter permease [Vitreoscilla stercoraria]|uniref:Metal ABC transporter permease n=1 Tax=Vitreoscilla stercoraria TaxID=61 RepID=A0ABY4E6Z7_VITST|nr:metal ABC transporter permease [Vitreoscilla stercoraria]UOO91525.1 metal ABC transporter permease [Vitreoscilla stercoraria]
MWDVFIAPFTEFQFMRAALVSVCFLALSAAPVGVFLVLRRMSLMGDALSHAVLPGAAAGYMVAGLSVPAMSLGGFIAGVLMAILAGLVSRFTTLKEDASFAAFYLSSLALGVLMVSRSGNNVDLLNLLFGSILGIDAASLALIAGVASVTVIALAVMYRPLVMESIDPLFLRSVGGKGSWWHLLLMLLVVLNLVAGFQALGTLMSVGLMMLPAISARLWSQRLGVILSISALVALVCGYLGLLLSFYVEIPSGPAIILLCGMVYLVSVFLGTEGGLIAQWMRGRHKKA